MPTIVKILFATDFSEASHRALSHAVEFARRYKAELTILHCRTLFADDPHNIEFRFLDDEKYEDCLKGNLGEVAQRVDKGIECKTAIVRNVSPAAGILDFCHEERPDLVVMGTHGRSAIGHFFLGSVAEKVVRYAPCAVLTVGRHRSEEDRTSYRKILVPFDFSPHSCQAARHAREIASFYQARVEVFYTVEQEVHPAFFDVWVNAIQHRVDEIAENVRKELVGALGEEHAEQVDVHVRIGIDRSDREIVRYAAEHKPDLIVMGTHGLSGIDHALLGSTTERVIRQADCPVLAIKLLDDRHQPSG